MKQFVDSLQPIAIVRKLTKPIEGEECHGVISVHERQPNFQLGNKEYIWGRKAGEIAWLSKCSCSNDYCLITQRWKNRKIKWYRLNPPGNRWGKEEEYSSKACESPRDLLQTLKEDTCANLGLCNPIENSHLIWKTDCDTIWWSLNGFREKHLRNTPPADAGKWDQGWNSSSTSTASGPVLSTLHTLFNFFPFT